MGSPDDARGARRPVDAAALAAIRRRMARAAAPPWLHAEVARRMAERLAIVKRQPARVLDWQAHTGASRALLRAAYPQAKVLAVEASAERREATAAALQPRWWSLERWRGAGPAVIDPDAVPDAAAQLLWANMALHGEADPPSLLRRWQRALAVDGFLMFSTLGPGSLTALTALYTRLGWPAPLAPFVDMHDIGDMLVEAGFADPVMDQELLTLTWASPEAALAELRSLGGNAHPARHAGWRTPRWRARLLEALGTLADDQGRIALGFEVVYGHAFKPPPRARVQAETQVSLDDMRAIVRAGRPPPRR
jgi:malonyl-CoA O-methyltransferase